MDGFYSQSLSDAVSPTTQYNRQQPVDPTTSSSAGLSSEIFNEANGTKPPRKCSVRGCMTVMPVDTTNKMCEACRQRHRVYATTKRLKRKMEKDAINQQNAALLSTAQPVGSVWVDETDKKSEHGITNDPQKQSAVIPQIQPTSNVSISVPSDNGPQWDSVLDPQLVSSRSSGLANPSTLPSQIPPPPRLSSPNGEFPITGDDPCVSSSSQVPGADNSMDVDVQHIFKACNTASNAPLGSVRYCSVKGCKAAIPNDYFFKMCEPCRDRYRTYGITKRAKCRTKRVAANTELEALRIEEDKRRAEEGLPPLADSPEDWITWQNDIIVPPLLTNTDDKQGPFPPRMCTVSHCHAILTGDYKYRRCEQHRIQNRHHSKLKRIREKDMKAQAAALIPEAGLEPTDDTFRMWEPGGESLRRKDDETEQLFINTPIEPRSRGTTETVDHPLPGGRESHTCSIKVCYNLLNPRIPWKMCDPCREHDRQNRRNKKLREENRLPPLRFRSKHRLISQPGLHEPPSSTTENDVLSVYDGTTSYTPSAPPDRPPSSSSSFNDADEVFTDLVGLPDNVQSTLDVPVGPSSSALEGSVQTPPNVDYAGVSSVVKDHRPAAASLKPLLTRKPRSGVKLKVPREPAAKKANKLKETTKKTASSIEPLNLDAQPPFPYSPPFNYWPPYYSPQPQHSGSSSPEPSPAKSPAFQQLYPYPSSYARPLTYVHPAFAVQQMHQFSYIPPYMSLYDPSLQPNLQPYSSSLYRYPFPFPPPSGLPPALFKLLKDDPSRIVPARPRKKRRSEPNLGVGDAELPGPNGSSSFPSVLNFSARSLISTSSAPPTSGKESVAEFEDNLDEPSNKISILPSVNGVPHGSRPCAKPSCHRQISAGTGGAWCDRCQTRLKERQAKARQRFKLEPKKLVIPLRAASARSE